MTADRRARVGLIVNPIAGMGGRVGLKGTDGSETLARAIALGAVAVAPIRADAVEAALRAADVVVERSDPDSAEGTRAAAASMSGGSVVPGASVAPTSRTDAELAPAAAVDLLVFVGGDGTARDICVAVGSAVAVLGVPSGVKMHSAVFATGPAAAAEVVRSWLRSSARPTRDGEVVDIDESAVRSGRMEVRLYGTLRVPAVPGRIQALKASSGSTSRDELVGLAADIVRRLTPGSVVILGPGTTTAALGSALGVEGSLLGVDVVEVGADRVGRLVARDAGESQILAALVGRPATIVVSPTGGQGFLLGRGNQQVSPAVLRAVGPEHLLVVATPAKLAALGTGPLYVDTGDVALDALLAGYRRVVTGQARESVVRIAAG